MGQAKHEMMKADEKRDLASDIATRAGVLDYCERHVVYYQTGADVEDAYKLGNSMYSKGELNEMFEDRREMTDFIKEAVGSCADECYGCTESRDDD
ncbi:hypothetical protein SAMN04487857_102376 [Pseudomonas sp. ok272]|uniref:hypothetical protein n=1 Tax=unclassified Pseudomonas TaxID=196821 RepID=UPI0008C497FA|nr:MULTISPECIES: hypothetical protein [unclassified Pseudomonas]SEM51241.1 hypothetical protein SAMN04487857_102376 [Pseudomonas sp. ok272]SFM22938.1 hypothetical protein SAMN04487858_101377 [Pseudomonas sp. ok602]